MDLNVVTNLTFQESLDDLFILPFLGTTGMRAYVNESLLGPGNSFVMDGETLNILTNKGKLIAMDCLTIGREVGNGHFGSVYKASLQLPGQDASIDVAVKTLKSRCKLFTHQIMPSL